MIHADVGAFCLRFMLVVMIDMILKLMSLVSFKCGSYLSGDGSMTRADTGELVRACGDCLVCTDVY